MRYAVFTMLGPGETDARRLRTMLRGLFRHEPATPVLAIVNDTGGPLPNLDDVVPGDCERIELVQRERRGIHGISHNTLLALRELSKRSDLDFVVKIDTDALVIGPFAVAIDEYFTAHPEIGQVGRAERMCDGSPTPFGLYGKFIRRMKRRFQVWRSPSWGVAQAFLGDHAKMRSLLIAAEKQSVSHGLHCQGGAYAIRRTALVAMEKAGLYDDAYARVIGMAEDLMTSTLVAAAGFRIASMSSPGEPFGVEATGLPFLPAELQAKGYGIIHSIKNDPRVSEADVVKFFQESDTIS